VGVVFSESVAHDVKEAIGPLIEHRRTVAEDRIKIFDAGNSFRSGEKAKEFFTRQGVDPLTADLEKVPYYLLLVGDPEAIPYDEQRYLSTQWLKGWGLGTYHGLRRKHVDSYLNEFVFRYNRRFYRHVSFETVLGLASRRQPTSYWEIIGRDNPRKGVAHRPASATAS
jgi:hypothetical protein